jgi:Tol biopolymer transport system component
VRNILSEGVINADGTNLRRLPPSVSYKNYDCRPAWSPDGKHIAFTPTNPYVDHTSGGIYLMNPNGQHVVHLKGTTGFTCGISWQRTH